MSNRAPGTAWSLRGALECGYVKTTDNDGILIALPGDLIGGALVGIEINRKDARLLAKRLNECLNATTKAATRKLRAVEEQP
jgi:hypothetical protein